jgi:hypothetical protein
MHWLHHCKVRHVDCSLQVRRALVANSDDNDSATTVYPRSWLQNGVLGRFRETSQGEVGFGKGWLSVEMWAPLKDEIGERSTHGVRCHA